MGLGARPQYLAPCSQGIRGSGPSRPFQLQLPRRQVLVNGLEGAARCRIGRGSSRGGRWRLSPR